MKKETLKESLETLQETSQRIKGEVILDHINYIKRKEGSGGLKKLEERMKDTGNPLELEKISSKDWASNDLSSKIILTAFHVFHWSEEDVFEMGSSSPRFSLWMRLLVQNIIRPKKMFRALPVYWRGLFDFGKLKPVEFDEKGQRARLQIEEMDIQHPLLYHYIMGYLKGLGEFMFKEKNITTKQTKSTLKGDNFDEYSIYWD